MLKMVLFFGVFFFCGGRARGDELRVLTLNTWLLDIPVGPFGIRTNLADDFDIRLKRMPKALSETGADVIALQEVWSQTSKRFLAEQMRAFGYGYAAYTKIIQWFMFFEVEMGDGLLILSKYPIIKKPEKLDFSISTHTSESFAKKGALHVEVLHPTLGGLDIYTSHVGAVQMEEGIFDRTQEMKRRLQIEELTKWIRKTRVHSISVLAADLNIDYRQQRNGRWTDHLSEEYETILKMACGKQNMIDSDRVVHAGEDSIPTFTHQNRYVDSGSYSSLPDEVEDYIFYCDSPRIKEIQSSRVFSDSFPLSDHFGVLTQMEVVEGSGKDK